MKKILIICLSCFTLLSTFTLSTFAQSNTENNISVRTSTIEPRSDILEWVYKTLNGKNIGAYGMQHRLAGLLTGFQYNNLYNLPF